MTQTAQHLKTLVSDLANAMSRQRAALETDNYDDLEATLADCQRAFDALSDYPGGLHALRDDINALPPAERTAARELIDRARIDHRIGDELVRVAMQRSAAVQAFQASQNEGATYSVQGGVETAAGSLLSRKA